MFKVGGEEDGEEEDVEEGFEGLGKLIPLL